MDQNNPMKIGVLVLAAGRSTRFGSDKRIAALADGAQVLHTQLDQIAVARLPVHVCLHPDDDALAAQLLQRGTPCRRYEKAKEGMGGTLAQAIGHVEAWDGVLIALADMPWIQAGTYRSVAHLLGRERICVPTYSGKRGHPVGFCRQYYVELSEIAGQAGARKILAKYPDDVHEVEVDDPAIHWDIDVPADITLDRSKV
ncbi:MAG: molybdenum cofactor cytidylyltransferase [Bacteroidia bacterium]|jgi:molybdenum cofactor cytidylyltransferase